MKSWPLAEHRAENSGTSVQFGSDAQNKSTLNNFRSYQNDVCSEKKKISSRRENKTNVISPRVFAPEKSRTRSGGHQKRFRRVKKKTDLVALSQKKGSLIRKNKGLNHGIAHRKPRRPTEQGEKKLRNLGAVQHQKNGAVLEQIHEYN